MAGYPNVQPQWNAPKPFGGNSAIGAIPNNMRVHRTPGTLGLPTQAALAPRQSNQNPSGIPKPAFANGFAQTGATAPSSGIDTSWERQGGGALPAGPGKVATPKQRKPINPALTAAPSAQSFGPPDDSLYPTIPKTSFGEARALQGSGGNIRTLVDSRNNQTMALRPIDIENSEVPSGGGIATMGDETVMLRGGNSVPQAENDSLIAHREQAYAPRATTVGGAGGVVNAVPGQSIAGALNPVGTTIEDAIAYKRNLKEQALAGEDRLQQAQIGHMSALNTKLGVETQEMPLNNLSERQARSAQTQNAAGHLNIAERMVQPNIDAINNQTAMTNETIDQNRIMRPLQAIGQRLANDNFVSKGEMQKEKLDARQEERFAQMIAEANKLPSEEQREFAIEQANAWRNGLERVQISKKQEKVPGKFFGWGAKEEVPAEYGYQKREALGAIGG